MTWRRKEPGHQQPWYWLGWTRLTLSQHVGTYYGMVSVHPPVNCVRDNSKNTFQDHVIFYARHYDDVIMTTLASQITSLTVVYSIVYSGVIQRKHQSSASLAFVREIHRGPVNFPHKWPVTRKMFPFDDVIMIFGDIYADAIENQYHSALLMRKMTQ